MVVSRFLAASLALLAVPFLAGGSQFATTDPATDAISNPGIPAWLASFDLQPMAGVASCDNVTIDSSATKALDMVCDTGEIRPGARSSGCTLNFVMEDAVGDTYIGTAGHCGGVGKKWSISGLGEIGVTVFREFVPNLLNLRDWNLIKVHDHQVANVTSTMYRFGGPHGPATAPDPAPNVRVPLPGETVFHFGHGNGFGREHATKGRIAPVVAPLGLTAFVMAGTVGGGDSGSPVRIASGEAAGIAVMGGVLKTGDNRGYVEARCTYIDTNSQGFSDDSCEGYREVCSHLEGACNSFWNPNGLYGIVIATRFDAALEAFRGHLGHDIWVVDGELVGASLA